MNKKQIAAIKRLEAAIDACEKAGVVFANTCDNTLTPYKNEDNIVTYNESIRIESGKIFLWDMEIQAKDLTYLEYQKDHPLLAAHSERFEEYESLQIRLSPSFLQTIADDGLVIVKNPNA